MTDEGGQRRQMGGRSAPAGRTSVRARAQRAACAQSAGADTPAAGSRRSRHERRRTPWPADPDRPAPPTDDATPWRPHSLSATGHRTEGTGGFGAIDGLYWPFASALERPAPRKTAPPSSTSSPGAAGAPVFLVRRAARGQGGVGAPRLPASAGQPRHGSASPRAVTTYGGGIAATPAAAHIHATVTPRPSRHTRTARAPHDARPARSPAPTPYLPTPRPPHSPSRRLDGSPPLLSNTHPLAPHPPSPASACRRPA
jgi:hypothetical protein